MFDSRLHDDLVRLNETLERIADALVKADGVASIVAATGREDEWEYCVFSDAERFRARVLTGSLGLEGPWSDWSFNLPSRLMQNREYQFQRRKLVVKQAPGEDYPAQNEVTFAGRDGL